MKDKKLTKNEIEQLEEIIEAGSEHAGFVNGGDVYRIASMLLRLFGETEEQPEQKREQEDADACTKQRGRPRKTKAEDGAKGESREKSLETSKS